MPLDAAGPVADTLVGVTGVLFVGGALIFAAVMLLLWPRRRAARAAVRAARAGCSAAASPFRVVLLGRCSLQRAPRRRARRRRAPAGRAARRRHRAHVVVGGALPRPGRRRDIVPPTSCTLPVGRPVHLALASADVIHSFWVPALAGKMDMVPGRVNHLVLQADAAGRARAAQCAEFCGEQHARMALHVVAQPPAGFDAWLARRRAGARAPATPLAARAAATPFVAQRCAACHTVRGVRPLRAPRRRARPDARRQPRAPRRRHAAATTPRHAARWIADAQQLKPGARMPSYAHLDARHAGRARRPTWRSLQ